MIRYARFFKRDLNHKNNAARPQNLYGGKLFMTKIQFAAAVAEKSGLNHRQAEKAVNAVMDVITESLANGEKVALTGFGTFDVKERKERTGINPLTKKAINIPASKTPVSKAGSKLKDALK